MPMRSSAAWAKLKEKKKRKWSNLGEVPLSARKQHERSPPRDVRSERLSGLVRSTN